MTPPDLIRSAGSTAATHAAARTNGKGAHPPAPPTSRGRAWIAAVVFILGGTVALNGWVLRLANADPSFAVEPDYYRRALRWDDELAQRERNAALGWTLEPNVGGTSAVGAELRVRLADSSGAALRGASVLVSAFPVARSSHVIAAALHEGTRDAGGYSARVAIDRPGEWELRFEATRGADVFTAVRRVRVAGGAP